MNKIAGLEPRSRIFVDLARDYNLSDGMPEAVVSLALRMGWNLNEHDRALLLNCKSLEDTMERLTESELLRKIMLDGNTVAQGRLGEFYVALLTGGHWDPSPGFDVHTSCRLPNTTLVNTAKIEVRTCSDSFSSHQRIAKITGESREITYDVLVIIGFMGDSFNPCRARMFAVPGHILESKCKDKDYRVQIGINKNRISSYSGQLNKYWNYWVPVHTELKSAITSYSHGRVYIASSSEGLVLQNDFFHLLD